jgi:hypothetical protein
LLAMLRTYRSAIAAEAKIVTASEAAIIAAM